MPRSRGRLRHLRAGRAGDPDYEIPVRPKTSKPDARFSHWRRVDCQGDDAPPLGAGAFPELDSSQGRLDASGPRYAVDPEAFRTESSSHPEAKWTDTNRLLELESKCANIYWLEYRNAIRAIWPDSGFINRGNLSYSWTRNATDPINALLNYRYAISEVRCRVAVVQAGFESTIGYLHSIAPSKHPIVYDFQESARALVDSGSLRWPAPSLRSERKERSFELPTGGPGWLQRRPRSSSRGYALPFPARCLGSDP